MSELTTDMVWLVNKEITLADGRKVTALVPQVYLVARNSDITSRGAVISANQIIGNVDNLQNSGVIVGRDLTRLHSNQLENRGTILGDTVDLSAKQNLINLGGKIEAVKDLSLYAGKNLEISSTLSSSQSADGNFARTVLDQLASVKVTGEGGRLTLHSGDNLTIKAANIESQGALNASADKSLQITTLKTQNREHYNGNADNYYRLAQEAEVGTRLSGKDGVKLFGVDGVTLRQVDVRGDGDVSVISQKGNITLESGRAKESLATSVKSNSKGLFSKSSRLSEHEHQTDAAVVNSLQGQNMTLYAGNKITDEGSVIKGGDHIYLEGKNGVELNTAQNTHSERNYTELKKAGLTASLSSGTARIGVGRNKQKDANTERQISHIGTQLNAENGNITVVSTQGDVTANATQFDAKKDIAIEGQNVYLNAEIDKQDNQESHSSKSAGFGIGVVYNPVAKLKDYYGEQSSQGSAKGIVGKVVTAGEAIDKTSQQLLNGVGSYFTANKKQEERFNQTEKANVVEMNAGGNLAIHANKGSIVSQGAHISAKGDGTFWAKENVHFDVATTEQSQSGKLKQKGVDIDSSRRLTDIVGVYSGKEKGDGELVQEQAGGLSFGGATTVIAEKGDITLAGTQLVSDGKIKLSAGNNVNITTAKTTQGQDEAGKSHGFGEAVISETERFSGYNRQLNSQNGHAVSHQGSMIASLKDDVEIYAGKDFHATSGQILAKNRIELSAEKVTFDTAHNTANNHHHSSDLKFGQFTRVISPIIDLVQSVESTLKDKEASDRVKAAQVLGLAAQGYILNNAINNALNHKDNSVLFRVETGTGLAHSRQSGENRVSESLGNQVNAQHIHIEARSGKLSAIQTDFTSKDEQGKRLANSSVALSGKEGVELLAGESTGYQRHKNQSYGTEVGTALSVGAKTGWSFYAKEGFQKGKQTSESMTYHNSHIDSETFRLNSGGDVTMKGATAHANSIHADIDGKLHIESLQDSHQSKSTQGGLNTKVEFGFGSSWEFSGNANLSGGKSNANGVNEQSGLFAKDGGYHITADEVELNAGAIASTNPDNSELTTNVITFSDIQNYSQHQATSGSLSGGYSQSNGVSGSPGMPMNSQGNDNSTTKATLTEGKITLNKDSTPTQTTAKALGINTALSQAHRAVEQPKDINQVLKEQQILSQSAGQVSGAVISYADKQREEIKQAEEKARKSAKEAEQAGDIVTAQVKYHEAQMLEREAARWETGGDKKRQANAVAAALSLAVAGKPAEAIAAGAASPYINEAIKHITDNKALEALNIPLHILWGAVEAELAGGSAKAGAIAAGVGEVGATVLAQAVYGKAASDLTTEEKANLLASAKLLAGVASGAVSGGNGTETLANASIGMTVAENAVESNYLSDWQKAQQAKELKECNGNGYCEFKINAYWTAVNLGQDTSFVSGLAVGVPESIAEGVLDGIKMALSPIETLEAIKVMITQDDAFNKLTEATKQSYVERIEKLQSEYEKAGASGSFNAGRETGHLLSDIVSIAAGGVGLAKMGTSAINKGITAAAKNVKALNIDRPKFATCSFHGDMEVKTDKGYRPISSIKVGDKVLAKNEITGITTYQKVQAHYNNPYDYTVYVEVTNSKGQYQTIVSNKIHPFFAQVLSGIAPISSKGHHYKGEIAKAQWVDAQYLQKGYRLLSANDEWQTVSNVTQKAEALKAYNMTVDKDHTYFIKGAKADNEGVWVHNDCWHALPNGAKQVASIDGYKAYQFTDPKDGKVLTVVQKDLNRFETPNHQAGVDPHFNRLSQQIDAETGRYLSTDNPVDGLYNRAYLRSETLQKIYANYEKLPNGNYRDLDGNIIKGPIDIGHAYGWEHRRLSLAAKELNWSQKQFNDYVNARPEMFRLENMSENRSHKNEMPGKHDIKLIIDDMKKFQQKQIGE
ncbi:hypothetical protein GM698_03465 [Mannheimia sp. ZY171111]|nr:hemagglutinin repeat-containing protein [Mannheimia sp. ZY171111]QTM00730.1 hypothetical protein GM698_03465 [Mannheimia sp. ZY171111]